MALMPQPDIAAPDTTDARPWPSPRRAWTVALLLSLASIASQFDRVVLNLTVEPVKAEFGLDDTSFALLQGVAFGIFYTLGAVPLGRLADRYERRIVLGISLFFFSLASMASGLARNFSQLFLSRVAVGCGEASVTPSGLSLLSDLFPPEKLGRAVSVFFLSAPFGIGLAFMAGGKLLQSLTERWHGSGLPFGLEPWQAAFLIVGAPGLLLAPLLLFMKEPDRRGPGGAAPLSIAEVLGVIRARRRALTLMFAGFSMVTVVNFAYNVWTPALFARVYGWTPAQVGIGFGLIMMICGTGGTYFAGWLSDRLTRAGHVDAHLRVAAFGFLACGVFGTLAPLMPNAWMALALIAPAMFLSCMPVPCAGTALQLILPNRARGQVTALYIMVISLVGIGIGPVVIGFMTDHLFTAPTDIRYSLAIVVGCAAPLMCGLLLLALKPYRALRQAGLEGSRGSATRAVPRRRRGSSPAVGTGPRPAPGNSKLQVLVNAVRYKAPASTPKRTVTPDLIRGPAFRHSQRADESGVAGQACPEPVEGPGMTKEAIACSDHLRTSAKDGTICK